MCKMEKQNSQLEHGQPMDQTRGLFCMCDSGVVAVNHNTSINSGSKGIAWASELGSYQTKVCNS